LYKETCEKLITKERKQKTYFFPIIQCSFANEPLTIKPVTCVPGIGPKHGNLCEKQGYVNTHILFYLFCLVFLLKDYYGSSITIEIYDECQ
jgi:hypothetical protein